MCFRISFLRITLVFALSLLLITSFSYFRYYRPSYSTYAAFNEHELANSQRTIEHNPAAKYVLFKQLRGAGFNNQIQEIPLFHHLALLTSRTYLYQPFIWRPRGENAQVPLSVFLSSITKSSVSVAFFDQICPPSETRHVELRTDHDVQWEHARQVLSDATEKCVVVDDWILNWNFLASTGIHTIWPSYAKYLSDHFEWSSPIRTIVARAQKKLKLRSSPNATDGEPYMALHLRRGDFEDHCKSLSTTQTGFTTWATLPFLSSPSRILPPPLDPSDATSILIHCYPSLNRIFFALRTAAHAHPHIRVLHILHDGALDHLGVYLQYAKIRDVVMREGWTVREGMEAYGVVSGDIEPAPMRRVTHTGQIPLSWGESDWQVAVDVEIARKAEVFVGNGYSSLSTMVLALKVGADGSGSDSVLLV